MNRLVKLSVCGAALAFSAGCAGVVKSTKLREDWESVDKNRVKRLVIVTQPYPADDPNVAQMWSRMAGKRVDLKREFIVKDKRAQPGSEAVELKTLCVEGVDGVLWLKPDVKRKGNGTEAQVTAKLLRCVDGEQVWATEAGGSWSSDDAKLKETIADYTSEFGPGVEPYVAASYHLLNDALDTLPNPVLTEEEQGEKIEYTQ